jgi:hypothetical protein
MAGFVAEKVLTGQVIFSSWDAVEKRIGRHFDGCAGRRERLVFSLRTQ